MRAAQQCAPATLQTSEGAANRVGVDVIAYIRRKPPSPEFPRLATGDGEAGQNDGRRAGESVEVLALLRELKRLSAEQRADWERGDRRRARRADICRRIQELTGPTSGRRAS